MSLLHTAEQAAIYQRMQAELAAGLDTEGARRLRYILDAAEKDGTPSALYASIGRWAGLAYQITGEVRYAEKALAQWWTDGAPNITGGDNLREYFLEAGWLFDTLRPVMDDTEVARWRDWHAERAERILGSGSYYGTRMGDSDQCLGSYLGLALWDCLLGSHYLTRTFKDPDRNASFPVGGLHASGANYDSMRNAVEKYLTVSHGGNWCESGMYTKGTTQLLYMGVEWIRRAAQDDTLFPLERSFRAAHVEQTFHELTPDLKDCFQYGDEQNPASLQFPVRRHLILMLAALAQDDRLIQLERDILAANAGDTDFRPDYWLSPRAFYFADPDRPGQPWRDSIPCCHVSAGQGHVYARTGHTPYASAIHVYWPTFKDGAFDHYESFGAGSIQLYRDGKRVLTHPLAYGVDRRYHNQTLVNGMGPSLEATGLIGTAFREGEFLYAAGLTAGTPPNVYDGYYEPAPTYLHENSRAVFAFLDGPDDLLLVFERFHVDDAKALTTQASWNPALTLGWTDHYRAAAEQAVINQRKGVIETLWHLPTEPTVWSSGTLSWGGVTINPHWPMPKWVLVDETADQTLGGKLHEGQKKWCAHAVNDRTGFSTQMTVISTMTSSWDVHNVYHGYLEGVRVIRVGKPDAVVLFSNVPGPRLETTRNGDRAQLDGAAKFQRVRDARLIHVVPPDLPTGVQLYIADVAVDIPGLTRIGEVQVGTLGVAEPPPPPSEVVTLDTLNGKLDDALAILRKHFTA